MNLKTGNTLRWSIRSIYRLSLVHSLLNNFTMDGFSFHDNWKTLRWSRHIRICFPYHTSVNVCTRTLLSRRSACAPHSRINKNIKHYVGPDLGPNCQPILSAADKGSRTAWCLRSKPPLLLLARGGLGVRGGGGGRGAQLWQRFFSWWWERGSKHHYKRAIIGLPAKHHLNGVSLIDDPTWNADLVALWF